MKKEHVLFWMAGVLFVIAGSLAYWKVGSLFVNFPILPLAVSFVYLNLMIFYEEIAKKINHFFIENCLFILGFLISLITFGFVCFSDLPEGFIGFQFGFAVILAAINLMVSSFRGLCKEIKKEED